MRRETGPALVAAKAARMALQAAAADEEDVSAAEPSMVRLGAALYIQVSARASTLPPPPPPPPPPHTHTHCLISPLSNRSLP